MCFVPSIHNYERGRGAAGEAVTASVHLQANTRSDGPCVAAVYSRRVGDAATNKVLHNNLWTYIPWKQTHSSSSTQGRALFLFLHRNTCLHDTVHLHTRARVWARTPRTVGLYLKPLFAYTIHKKDMETDESRASPARLSAQRGTQQTLTANDQKEKQTLSGCVVMHPVEN